MADNNGFGVQYVPNAESGFVWRGSMPDQWTRALADWWTRPGPRMMAAPDPQNPNVSVLKDAPLPTPGKGGGGAPGQAAPVPMPAPPPAAGDAADSPSFRAAMQQSLDDFWSKKGPAAQPPVPAGAPALTRTPRGDVAAGPGGMSVELGDLLRPGAPTGLGDPPLPEVTAAAKFAAAQTPLPTDRAPQGGGKAPQGGGNPPMDLPQYVAGAPHPFGRAYALPEGSPPAAPVNISYGGGPLTPMTADNPAGRPGGGAGGLSLSAVDDMMHGDRYSRMAAHVAVPALASLGAEQMRLGFEQRKLDMLNSPEFKQQQLRDTLLGKMPTAGPADVALINQMVQQVHPVQGQVTVDPAAQLMNLAPGLLSAAKQGPYKGDPGGLAGLALETYPELMQQHPDLVMNWLVSQFGGLSGLKGQVTTLGQTDRPSAGEILSPSNWFGQSTRSKGADWLRARLSGGGSPPMRPAGANPGGGANPPMTPPGGAWRPSVPAGGAPAAALR